MRSFLSGLAALSLGVACLTFAPSAGRAGGYGGSLYGSAYGGGSSYSMSTGAYAPSYGNSSYGNSYSSTHGHSGGSPSGTALPSSGGFPRVGPVYAYSNNFGAQTTPSYPTYNRGTNYASPPQYPAQINSTMHMRRWSMRRGF